MKKYLTMFLLIRKNILYISLFINFFLCLIIIFYVLSSSFRKEIKYFYNKVQNSYFNNELKENDLVNLKIYNQYQYLDILKNSINIAHRGGPTWIGGDNSIETIQSGYKMGYKFFEIDLVISNSNKIYCYHGYQNDGVKIKNFTNFAIDKALKKQNLQTCTIYNLFEFLLSNKDAYLIIDSKSDFKKLYTKISSIIENENKFSVLRKRIIPQIYFFNQIKILNDLNVKFASPIFTAYLNKRPLEQIFFFAEKVGIKIITLPSHRFDDYILENKIPKHLNIFLHGGYNMDIIPILEKYLSFGVSGYYNKTLPKLQNIQ